MKVGGVEKLDVAVREGRVKQTMYNDIKMYMFPKIAVGRRQTNAVVKDTSREKKISDFNALSSVCFQYAE